MPGDAYLNGQLLPAERLSMPVDDAGFLYGATVAERLRTFGGRLFRWPEHLSRLLDSLRVLELDAAIDPAAVSSAADELAAKNHRLLAEGDDLGLTVLVTPGEAANPAPAPGAAPRVAMLTQPVAFASFAHQYQAGVRLVVTDIRQVPPNCWPPSLKCRSRMHYYLADRQARRADPLARAVLTDQEGFVSECSTANIVAYLAGQGLVSPPLEKILPGISLSMLFELAAARGIPTIYRDFTVGELAAAEEAMITSTSPCVLPVVRLDGRPIGAGEPGPVFRDLLADWSRAVGVDVAGQARRFADRAQ